MPNKDAAKLTMIWNKVLLSNQIEICTEQLKGLSINELKLLKIAYFSPENKIKDYLMILNIPNSTFTNILNRLVKQNLIQRKLDDHDLRSFSLELTPLGKEGVQKHLEKEEQLFASVLEKLDAKERQHFLVLLDKMIS